MDWMLMLVVGVHSFHYFTIVILYFFMPIKGDITDNDNIQLEEEKGVIWKKTSNDQSSFIKL